MLGRPRTRAVSPSSALDAQRSPPRSRIAMRLPGGGLIRSIRGRACGSLPAIRRAARRAQPPRGAPSPRVAPPSGRTVGGPTIGVPVVVSMPGQGVPFDVDPLRRNSRCVPPEPVRWRGVTGAAPRFVSTISRSPPCCGSTSTTTMPEARHAILSLSSGGARAAPSQAPGGQGVCVCHPLPRVLAVDKLGAPARCGIPGRRGGAHGGVEHGRGRRALDRVHRSTAMRTSAPSSSSRSTRTRPL